MTNPSTDFDEFMALREAASQAFVNGDYDRLGRISTHSSPATLFDPLGHCICGAARVNSANEKSAALFKPGSDDRFEVMHKAEDNNLAYWVGIQRSVVQMKGQDEGIPMDFRVTEIFRREAGAWKLMHRHADPLKKKQNPTAVPFNRAKKETTGSAGIRTP